MNQIKSFDLIPLDKINIEGTLGRVYSIFKDLVDKNDLPNNAIYNLDYKKWMVILERSAGYSSFLDIGPGMGQLANAAAMSGQFSKTIAMDSNFHSKFLNISNLELVEYDLRDEPQPQFRSEFVVYQSGLGKWTTSRLPEIIQNLYFLTKKRLVIIVPYYLSPPPNNQKQTFTVTKMENLFPLGKITLLSSGPNIRWAMIEIDMSVH